MPPAPPLPDGEENLEVMSFGEHLEELRRRLIFALIVPLPLAVLAFVLADSIREIMTAPLYAALEARRLPTQVQALSPVETLTTDLFLAVILSLVLSAPWLVYQLWKFVEPGLYANERRFAHFLMPASGVLVALADRFGLPIHAIGVGEQIDDLAPFDPEDFAKALTGAE